jgi:hypothetical protein
VGHKADLRDRDGRVRAEELGTGKRYGWLLMNSGRAGGVGATVKRRVVRSPRFLIRFRCPSSGASRP